MPFLRFAGLQAKTREVSPQGHRIYQSAALYDRWSCPVREHILPLPCRSVRRAVCQYRIAYFHFTGSHFLYQ